MYIIEKKNSTKSDDNVLLIIINFLKFKFIFECNRFFKLKLSTYILMVSAVKF